MHFDLVYIIMNFDLVYFIITFDLVCIMNLTWRILSGPVVQLEEEASDDEDEDGRPRIKLIDNNADDNQVIHSLIIHNRSWIKLIIIFIGYCINTSFYDRGRVSDTLPSLRGNALPRHERGHKILYLYNNLIIIYLYQINRNHADT